MPVYNEAHSIEETVRNIFKKIIAKIPNSQIIIVDDGSFDGSEKILDRFAQEKPEVIKVIHKTNTGHGPSIYQGLESADAEWLFLLDSDNQIEIEDFEKLWQRKDEADILIGKRIVRHDPLIRLWLSAIIRWFLKLSFKVNIYDANVPFKLIKSSLWHKVKKYIPADSLAPSLFLAVAAKKLGYKMQEIEVRHYPRQKGRSSLGGIKLIRFCFRAYRELLSFRTALFKSHLIA